MANVSLPVCCVGEVPELRLHTHYFSATEVAELIYCILLLLFLKIALDYGGIWSRSVKNILRKRFGDFWREDPGKASKRLLEGILSTLTIASHRSRT